MTIVRKAEAPVFQLPGATFVGLASPRRGARETCMWHVTVAPGAPGHAHQVTREEVFVAVAGAAVAQLDGQEHRIGAGDALIVPPNTQFALSNPSEEAFEAIVSFPVGGQAVTGEGRFTPPWAE